MVETQNPPEFDLMINHEAPPNSVLQFLTNWSVHQAFSQPSTCELTFIDPEEEVCAIFELGTALSLFVGATRILLFSGTVTTVHHQLSDGLRILTVRAGDQLTLWQQKQQLVKRASNTPAGHLRTAVTGTSISVWASEDGPQLPLMIQWGMNDLDWLSAICAIYGLYFYLHDSTLKLITLDGTRRTVIALDVKTNLFECSIESNTHDLHNKSVASSWDPVAIKAYSGSAKSSTVGNNEERSLVGGSGVQSETTLSKVAGADLARSSARNRWFEGLADGDVRYYPGQCVQISGLKGVDSNPFVITRATHTYDASRGFLSKLSSLPPSDPQRLSSPSITLGTVTDTNDPEHSGRAKAELVAFECAETDWMSVATNNAGSDRGVVMQPEKGDSVIVALASDNPAQGVIIGSVYGDHKMPDKEVRGKRPRPYTIQTGDGQSLRLDDQQRAVTLKSHGGSLDLHPKKVVLHADTDLQIEAPGKKITIMAKKVDFKEG